MLSHEGIFAGDDVEDASQFAADALDRHLKARGKVKKSGVAQKYRKSGIAPEYQVRPPF